MDGGGGYTTNVNVINATELYTSSEFYAMYFTIKKMLKKNQHIINVLKSSSLLFNSSNTSRFGILL